MIEKHELHVIGCFAFSSCLRISVEKMIVGSGIRLGFTVNPKDITDKLSFIEKGNIRKVLLYNINQIMWGLKPKLHAGWTELL